MVRNDVEMMKAPWFISFLTRCFGSQYPEIGMVEKMVAMTVAIVRQTLMALITCWSPSALHGCCCSKALILQLLHWG